jgi:hypothetical protein
VNKLKDEIFKKKARKKHGNRYIYDNVDYIKNNIEVEIICPEHGPFPQKPNNHLNGSGCPDCSSTKRSNTEEFKEKANLKHDFKYDYSLVNYINNRTNVEIICPIHGPFPQTPDNHLRGKGCPDCGGSKQSNTEKFIEKANPKHDFKYDYSLVNYIKSNIEVKIICSIHGIFPQTPSSHLRGAGCPDCGGCKQSNTEEFIKKANPKHDFKYDYSLVNYIGATTDVEIICPTHGSFPQTPDAHLRGQGCPDCYGNRKSDTEKFKEKANIKHDFKYDYSLVNYINNRTDVEIICPIHGPFPQTPSNHLKGQGCPTCTHHISKPEVAWLNSLNLPDDKEHRHVYIKIKERKRGFRVDGFDPATNTVYEFYGDFWHGNPNNSKFKPEDYNPRAHCTFGELYAKTLAKEQILKSAGYNVVSIWESDFKESLK